MMLVAAVLLLVIAGGTAVRCAALGLPSSARAWWAALADGVLLGPLLLGGLLWWAGDWPLTQALTTICVLGAVGVAGLLLMGWRRHRQRAPAVSGPGPAKAMPEPAVWLAGGWQQQALKAWLLLLALALLTQSLALPVLAWDAWHAWLDKSKLWFFAGRFVELQSFATWLASEPGANRFAIATEYPQGLPRLWAVLQFAAGHWQDAHLLPIWNLLWLALGGLLWHSLRVERVGALAAWAWVLGLLSLPMVLAHASLAGYSDLWLASAILAFCVHASAALRGQPRHWLMVALYGLLLPTIKLEGAVYLLLMLVALGFAILPGRLRLWLAAAGLLAVAGTLAMGGFDLPLPGLGVVGLKWGLISVPVVGELPIYWRGVGGRVLESMLLLPNWSLLWWALPFALWWGRRRLLQRNVLFVLAGLLFAASFHFVLFCFTDAAAWAESLTSLNRLLLHVAPSWVWLMAVALRSEPAPYGRHRPVAG